MFNGAEQVIENNLIYFEEVHGREPGSKEPVRCKDCTAHDDDKWCHAMRKHTEDDFFCADGVKRE